MRHEDIRDITADIISGICPSVSHRANASATNRRIPDIKH